MTFKLYVCYHEHELHAALRALPPLRWEIRTLDVADVWLVEETAEGDAVRMLIELKTPGDLSTSITDGRLRDQRQRMLERAADLMRERPERLVLCKVVVVGYVPRLTGTVRRMDPITMQYHDEALSSYAVKVGALPFSTLQSALWRMEVGDGISSMTLPSYRVLAEDLRRLVEHNAALLGRRSTTDVPAYERARRLTHSVRKGKRGVDAGSVMVAMLQQISGMSVVKAQAVRDYYGGRWLALCADVAEHAAAWTAASTAAERTKALRILEDIPIGERRLGPALALRLCTTLADITLDVPSSAEPAKRRRNK